MVEQTITRAEAKVRGFQRYFTGKPCKRGHVAERRTSGGNCVTCWAEWSVGHAQEMNAYRSKWNDANAEKSAARKRQWRLENPDKQRAATEAWNKANPGRMLARTRRWARLNPEKTAAKDSRRRALETKALGHHNAADLKRILRLQNHRCAYCKADFSVTKRHLDHIQPLALGGSNWPDNLQYLCAPCNLLKGAKDPVQFANERGLLL